jgi:hydroxymethylpyrimidine pyrophosphatase-like HAD family hydrolase
VSIRLIAIDLDGTTLRRDGTISPRTVAALSRAAAAGVTVSVATGRIFGAAEAFARRLGARGPVICANGGLIRDTTSGQVLRHMPLPPEIFTAAAEVGRATGLRLELFHTHTLYASDPAGKRRELWGRIQRVRSWRALTDLLGTLRNYRVRAISDWHPSDGLPEKLLIAGGTAPQLRAAYAEVVQRVGVPLTLTTSAGSDNLEVTAAGATKGSAVAWLAAHLGLGLKEVMVVGDSLNDLSMFELDCFKVAMGNAEAEIKERASFVTASNADDGVARAVERFVLGEAAV